MATTIGEVNINLRMNLVKLKEDVREGAGAASKATKDMARDIGEQTRGAKESLQLLGEEFGVHIPRGIRNVIAVIPGVGQALNAAFSSVAVLAIIGLIASMIPKIKEVVEWFDRIPGAEARAAEATSLLDHIQKMNEKAKELDTTLRLQGLTGEARAKELLAISREQNESAAERVRRIQLEIQALRGVAEQQQAIRTGLRGSVVGTMATPEARLAVAELANKYLELDSAVADVIVSSKEGAVQSKEMSATRLKELQAWQDKLKDLLTDSKELNQTLLANSLGNMNPQAPPVPLPSAQIPKGLQEDIIKNAQRIQAEVEKTDAAWQKQADDIKKSLQTEDEKIQAQIDLLEQLHGQGKLTDEELNKGIEQLNKSLDKSGKVWEDFGKGVGDTLKQAALFGRSWSDAFKSMAIELTQAILKMTLFKSLSGGAAGSGGGFFSSLLGGLLGRAEGGPVNAGQAYIVGEDGPEMFMPRTSGNIVPDIHGGSGLTIIHNNNIDARGSSITEEQFRRSLKESEDRTVARTVATQRNLAQRR